MVGIICAGGRSAEAFALHVVLHARMEREGFSRACLRDFVVTVASRYHPTMRGAILPMVVLAVALAGAQAAVPKDPFPEGAGKPALLKVCGNCHTADTVIQSVRTRQEWSDVIDQMARFGAEGSDQEFDQILSYLSRHFSPINVNKATAKDLESAFD